jgi:hypothetical protein
MTEAKMNELRGKALVGACTKDEVLEIIEYVNRLENLLDEGDMEDMYGTEGWRHLLGMDV